MYVKEFISLFSTILGTTDVYELFYQRVEKYGALFRTGDEEVMKKFLFYLTEQILRTRDNTLPSSYIFDHEELTLTFESVGVKAAVAVWISTMLPGIIESLEIYCDRVGQRS